MPDLFDDLNKILKKDLAPILINYLKDSNNNLPENINSFIEDPQIFLKDIFEKFSKNKDNDINQDIYTNIKNVTESDSGFQDDYDDLFQRLISIEENMIHIEKILKDKN